MPAKMRAFLISSRAAEKLPYDRITPAISGASELTLKLVFSPKASESTLPAAPLTHEWPDGYSGWFGVTSSEVKDRSSAVAGFPSMLPNGIANGDYILFEAMGAYTVSSRSPFNGYYPDSWAVIG